MTYSLLAKFVKGQSNGKVSKVAGMLRFYLQGKLPLAKQEWPKPLVKQKDAILAQMNK